MTRKAHCRIHLLSGFSSYPEDQLLDLIFPPEITNPVLAYIPPGPTKPTITTRHSELDSESAKTKIPGQARNDKKYNKFTRTWQKLASKRKAQFLFINITSDQPEIEKQKLLSANILLLTGGNTFTFLSNLRKSGLDKTITDFTHGITPKKSDIHSSLSTVCHPERAPSTATNYSASRRTPSESIPRSLPKTQTPRIIVAFSAGALLLTPTIKIASLPPEPRLTWRPDKNIVNLSDLSGLNLIPFEIFPHFKPKYQPILDQYRKTGIPLDHTSTACHPERAPFCPSSNSASRRTYHQVKPLPDGQVITHQL